MRWTGMPGDGREIEARVVLEHSRFELAQGGPGLDPELG
jgi:hypothetical protein